LNYDKNNANGQKIFEKIAERTHKKIINDFAKSINKGNINNILCFRA
jgi:hypothetical protein